MAFTATQYLFKASIPTSTVTATVGSYTVPASTRGQIIALTLTNTASTNITAYADVSVYDGSIAYPMVVKAPLYPGGNLIVEGVAKHTLPTGGAVYVTAYATNVSAVMSLVEVT
jgi:hypothetical protein